MSNDLTQTQSAIEGTQVPQETSVWRIIPGKDHELWEKRNEYIKGALLPDELWRCRCDCEFDKKEGNMVFHLAFDRIIAHRVYRSNAIVATHGNIDTAMRLMNKILEPFTCAIRAC